MSEPLEHFGPFLLLRELGVGGMGSAWLAMHAETQQLLVVKRLHAQMLSEPTMLERFVHEAEVATHVVHECVAGLVAMGSVGTEPFLATELVFGSQLSRLIDRIEDGATPPAPIGPALQIGAWLASGLRAIHEARHRETGAPLGLLHRDIGARNIMLGYDGVPRIIDLGLGKSVLADWQTSAEVLAGSPDYMPPEQAMGGRVDARADVYALAVTIWELVAGRKRIREPTVSKRIERCIGAQPEPIRQFRPEASERLERLLYQAMAAESEQRLPAAVLLEQGLNAELARLGWAGQVDQVARWVDSAFATVRARDSRRLEADRARGLAAVPKQREDTTMFVGDLASYARQTTPAAPVSEIFVPPPPSTLVERAPTEGDDGWVDRAAARVEPVRRELGHALEDLRLQARPWLGRAEAWLAEALQPLATLPAQTRWVLIGLLFAISLMVAAVTATLALPPTSVEVVSLPPPVETRPAAPSVARSPTLAPVVPEPSPVESAPTVEPEVEAAVSSEPERAEYTRADEARRRRLVERIRLLRKRSFAIDFQREVTRLSSRVSRARSRVALDSIERRIKLLEERS